MKKKLYILLIMFSAVAGLGGLSCSDDDDTPNCQGIDCLPEATQTGAGTFGCLVNGEPYFAFGGLNAQYQLIQGEYFFLIGFDRDVGFPESVNIIGNDIQLIGNQAYILSEDSDGNFYGRVTFTQLENGQFVRNNTDTNNTGILNITKLDQQNQIVSGTFEFEILNPDDGEVYQITEGRFDSFYAQ